MKEKIDKSILNRIEKLETKYPYIDVERNKEQINALIEWLEDYFGYSIKNRIDFSTFDYANIDDPERIVFKQLTIEELKKLVYDISEDKKMKKQVCS